MKNYLLKWRNKDAFTLAEALLALFIVILSSILLLSVFQGATHYRQFQGKDTILSAMQFRRALHYHLGEERVVSVSDTRLSTRKEERVYYYEWYKDSIRRTSDKGGHEPLLLSVQSVIFSQQRDYVHIIILLKNGEQYDFNVYITPEITSKESQS